MLHFQKGIVMDSKLFATKTQTILKELGYDVKLGHCYELLSKLSGYKSWNVAKNHGFDSLLGNLNDSRVIYANGEYPAGHPNWTPSPVLKIFTKQVGNWVRWDYKNHTNSLYVKATVEELDKWLDSVEAVPDLLPFKSAVIDHGIVSLFDPNSDCSFESIDIYDEDHATIEDFFLVYE